MTDFVFNFHSGWRYIVILMIFVAMGFYAYEYFTKKSTPHERKVDLAFTTSIHVQLLLGIVLLVIYIIEGLFEGRHMGHVVIMLLLGGVAGFYTRTSKVLAVANPDRRRLLGLVTPLVALVMIVIGLSAIGAGLFG